MYAWLQQTSEALVLAADCSPQSVYGDARQLFLHCINQSGVGAGFIAYGVLTVSQQPVIY